MNKFRFEKIKKAHLWRCYDGKELETRRCLICGQHIDNDEYYTLLVDNGKFRGNYLLHLEDFRKFLIKNNIKFEEEVSPNGNILIRTLELDYWKVLELLYQVKTPKLKNGNKENVEITHSVKNAMINLGFSVKENSKSIIFSKSNVKIRYQKKHKHFRCMNRLSIFDRYFLRSVYKKISDELLKENSSLDLSTFIFI